MPILLAEPSGEFRSVAAGQAAVYRHYSILTAAIPLDIERGLGGKLLFAGSLPQSTSLLKAANIAGAASLAASSDPSAGRQAMREGAIDFLVTSLEEALRILKNEIRKAQPVSVAVAAEAGTIVPQMLERGLLPDLLAASAGEAEAERRFVGQGSLLLSAPPSTAERYVAWSISPAGGNQPAGSPTGGQWLSQIDSLARALFAKDATARNRWLRLAPRYLGRSAQRQHGVMLSAAEEERFRAEAAAWAAAADAAEAVTLMLGRA